MRRVVSALGLALLVVLAPVGGEAGAQGRPRLDAQLRLMRAGRLLAPPGDPAGRVRLMVEVTGGAHRLAAYGFGAARAALPGSDLAFLTVRPDELAALSAVPGVRSLERAGVLHPTLERSVPACGVPPVREALGLDGRGVLVGVVDTGVDFRHLDFRAADGTTRVAALLDAGIARGALHPELPDYGGAALWLAADIDAQLFADKAGSTPAVPVGQRDSDGHGTHVAGIAVSGGLATAGNQPAGRYLGMAPAAQLVAARATRAGNSFQLDDVLAAVRFAFETADRAGKPAVVNLSLGGDSGPHDGTSGFERALASLAPDDAPGRCLVISAGNSGGRDRHAGGLQLEPHVEVPVSFSTSARATDRLNLELWFSTAPPSITLRSPGGRTVGPVALGQVLDRNAGTEGTVHIDNASTGVDPDNGRWNAGVVVTGQDGAAVAGGHWSLLLDGGGGRWDGWITDASGATADPRFLDHLDPDGRGDSPAYTRSAISVGSFVNRNTWLTVDGRMIQRPTTPGQSSLFSGTGPTADGRFFPDVMAPGDYVISALSSDTSPRAAGTAFYVAGDPTLLVADDGVHGALRGTSQAAPHVTGAVALLYQVDPRLTPRRLRELLRTAATPADGEPGYSTRWGFGRLDIGRAVALLRRQAVGPHDPARSTLGVSRDAVAPGERLVVSVVPRDRDGAPLGPGHTVALTTDGGRFDGEARDGGEGRWERTLLAEAPLGTVITLGAVVDGRPVEATARAWVVQRREDVGHPYLLSGGACSIAPHPTPTPWALVLWGRICISSFLRSRRRRRP